MAWWLCLRAGCGPRPTTEPCPVLPFGAKLCSRCGAFLEFFRLFVNGRPLFLGVRRVIIHCAVDGLKLRVVRGRCLRRGAGGRASGSPTTTFTGGGIQILARGCRSSDDNLAGAQTGALDGRHHLLDRHAVVGFALAPGKGSYLFGKVALVSVGVGRREGDCHGVLMSIGLRLFRFRELAGSKGCSASEPHRCTRLGVEKR